MNPTEVKQDLQTELELCAKLEDLAFHGAELPKDLSFPQALLFLKFRFLYRYAELAQMSPEQGRREKHEILQAYTIDKFNDDLYQHTVQMWKNIEAYAIEIRKDSALMENTKVQALLSALYGEVAGKES